jgi:predicted alpha/beta-fold hydrolase
MTKAIQTKPFKPAWWLRNHHLQSIWPTLFKRPLKMSVRHERRELPDGDFIDLAWAGDESKPIVILLHGLGGSLESSYVIRMMNAVVAQGWCALLMHFRGASGTPNRVDRSYHSGDTGDLAWLVSVISAIKTQPIVIVGYSLGGNVLLKWLGENAQQAQSICAAVAVSVPFELAKVANKLQQRSSRFYQWYLLKKL